MAHRINRFFLNLIISQKCVFTWAKSAWRAFRGTTEESWEASTSLRRTSVWVREAVGPRSAGGSSTWTGGTSGVWGEGKVLAAEISWVGVGLHKDKWSSQHYQSIRTCLTSGVTDIQLLPAATRSLSLFSQSRVLMKRLLISLDLWMYNTGLARPPLST